MYWKTGWNIVVLATASASLCFGCASQNRGVLVTQALQSEKSEDRLIDCLLPPQVRQLGRQVTYLSAGHIVKTTASDCEIRGGSQPDAAVTSSFSR
jgi:hypothetical protein